MMSSIELTETRLSPSKYWMNWHREPGPKAVAGTSIGIRSQGESATQADRNH